jgi:four helix bundle protein
VWRQAVDLAIKVYDITAQFPREERFGLADQIKRAAVSIPSNIAEGAARQTKKEFSKYLHMAQGSLSELDTQLEIARQLGLVEEGAWKDLDARLVEIDKMLSGLIRHQKLS